MRFEERASRRRGVQDVLRSFPVSRESARHGSSGSSSRISAPARGCCSAPVTTSRSHGRWARSATWSAACRARSRWRSPKGSTTHDVQSLLIEELELQPSPTVLVLEDVHWADDATFDSITVLGRRIGSLPALLVLTFRRGEAPPGSRLYATLGAIRAEDTVAVELTPLVRASRHDPGRG